MSGGASPSVGRARLRRALRVLPWAIAGAGALARIAAWAGGRSLWLDEAYVGANLADLDWLGLLGVLRHDQTAPPLWILLEKWFAWGVAMEERVLRLPALVGGIAALLLTVPLARRTLRPAAVPLAVLLMAVSHTALYYSQDMKPYSTDLAVCAALLLLGFHLVERVPREGACLAIAVGGATAAWFSFPAAFGLSGVGLVAMVAALRRGDRAGALRLVPVGAAWVAALAGLFVFSGDRASSNAFLQEFWDKAFPPVADGPSAVAAWAWRWLPDSCADAAGLRYGALAAPALVLGLLAIARRSPGRFAMLAAPVAWLLVAAAARLYPADGRVIVFLLPCLLLPVAEGCLAVTWRGGSARRWPAALLALLLAGWGTANAVALSIAPPRRQEIRPLLEILRERHRPGDLVYLHYGSAPAWRFYRVPQGLADVVPHIGPRGHGVPRVHLDDARRFLGRPRVWVVLSHWWWHDSGDERVALLGYFEDLGVRRAVFREPGAELHLFDLSVPPLRRPARRRGPGPPPPLRTSEEPQAEDVAPAAEDDADGGAPAEPPAGPEDR